MKNMEYRVVQSDCGYEKISMSFEDEQGEQDFIRFLADRIDKKLCRSVIIHDLDADIPKYEDYFHCPFSILDSDTPSPTIISANIDWETMNNVLGNWGFHTFGSYLLWTRLPIHDELNAVENAEVAVKHIYDSSLEITVKASLFGEIQKIISEFLMNGVKTTNE